MEKKDLSIIQLTILACLDDEVGTFYREIEQNTGFPKKLIMKEMKKLKEMDIVYVSSLVSLNGDPGYFGKGFLLNYYI